MTEQEILDYIKSTAKVIDLPLEDAQARRVATHLGRTLSIVAPLQALTLPADIEIAEIFRCAPFPASGTKSEGA